MNNVFKEMGGMQSQDSLSNLGVIRFGKKYIGFSNYLFTPRLVPIIRGASSMFRGNKVSQSL